MLKKKYIFIIFALLLIGIFSGCGKITKVNDDPALLTVWLLSEYRTESGNDNSVDSYIYDAQGNTVEFIRKENGTEIRYTYSYDEQGHIVETVRYRFGKPANRESTTYDHNGNKTEWVNIDAFENKVLQKEIYTYNDAGTLIEERYEDEDGVSTTVYTYDTHGNLAEYIYTKSDGTVKRKTFEYDQNRKLTAETEYKDDILVRRKTFLFDEKGNIIEETEDDGKAIETTSYKYDSHGNVVEYRNGSIKAVYEYDIPGRLTRITWYDGTSTYAHDWYEYDQCGNLISHSSHTRTYGDARIEKDTYAYDDERKLLSHVHNFDGNTTTYTYQYTKIRVTEEQAALLQEKYSKDRIYIAE